MPAHKKTHCIRGHLKTPETTNGSRGCLICHREWRPADPAAARLSARDRARERRAAERAARPARACERCGEELPERMKVSEVCDLCRFRELTGEPTEAGCELWLGTYDDAPGKGARFSYFDAELESGRNATTAGRWIYEQVHGEIPDGWRVYRECGDKRCVALAHLRIMPPAIWGAQMRSPIEGSWPTLSWADRHAWFLYRAEVLPELLERSAGRCEICGEPLDLGNAWHLTVDHNPPISAGGELLADLEHLRVCHRACNVTAYWSEQREAA